MTEFRTYASSSRVGRKKEYPDRITLPLAEGVVEQIDSVLEENEPRLDLIRCAIDREIRRRQRNQSAGLVLRP